MTSCVNFSIGRRARYSRYAAIALASACLASAHCMAASPLGLPATAAKSDFDSAKVVELGKWLFFDTRLSKDNTVSCATCHDPQTGWSNARAVGVGIGERVGTRNVPTLVNVTYASHLFWDGRESQLVDAVARPIEHPQEMDLPLALAAARLNNIEGYKERFAAVFAGPATAEAIARSLATFVATLKGGNAPVDRYRAGQLDALSDAARRGHDVFVFRPIAKCAIAGQCFRMATSTIWVLAWRAKSPMWDERL